MFETMLKTVFEWDHFLCYLSGAIDFDPTGGRDWRLDWTEKLVSIGFKRHQILNPCKKPLNGAQFNLDNEAELMSKHRKARAWKDLTETMSQIVHTDIRLVDKSDLVLVNMPKTPTAPFDSINREFGNTYELLCKSMEGTHGLDELNILKKCYDELLHLASDLRVPTYGTIHEIVLARQQRKPVYMVWEGGKDSCSAWLMYLIGHKNVFSTFDELLTRLDNISKGKAAYNAKDWLLLDLADKETSIME